MRRPDHGRSDPRSDRRSEEEHLPSRSSFREPCQLMRQAPSVVMEVAPPEWTFSGRRH